MEILVAILRLVRFGNCLLAAACVWLGAYLTWLRPSLWEPMGASIAALLVCAAGNALNDYLDIEIDRVNRPDRVLVRGDLPRILALRLAIGLSITALVSALIVSIDLAIVVTAAILLLYLYNRFLKRLVLVGNLVVGLLGAMTFLAGGIAVDPVMTFRLPGPLLPALYAFLIHLVREILKDVEDIEGDSRAGSRTLPHVIGASNALLVGLGLVFVLVIATYFPIFAGWYGRGYEIITVYLIDLPMLLVMILIWGYHPQKMLKFGSIYLKFCMILGVLALAIA